MTSDLPRSEPSPTASLPAQPSPPETSPPPTPLPVPSPPPETAPAPEPPPSSPVTSPTAESAPQPPSPAASTSGSTSEPSASESSTSASGGTSSPTKVRIDTPGASIEIEAHESLAEVVATALRVFHEAGGWPQVNSRSAGFAQTERRDTHPVQPSSMPYGPGSYPVQLP